MFKSRKECDIFVEGLIIKYSIEELNGAFIDALGEEKSDRELADQWCENIGGLSDKEFTDHVKENRKAWNGETAQYLRLINEAIVRSVSPLVQWNDEIDAAFHVFNEAFVEKAMENYKH